MALKSAFKATSAHYRVGEFIARILPKSSAYVLARCIARVYSLTTADFENVRSNMAALLPESTAKHEIARRSLKVFENFSRYLTNLFYSQDIDADFIRERVQVMGREHLDAALARGRGAIVVSAHLGNWEMGAMVLTEMRYRINAVALPHRDPGIEAFFQKRRDRHGLHVIPIGKSLRQMHTALKKGEILAMNADRLFTGDGTSVRFLGKDVRFPTGFSRISLKTGALVLPVFFTEINRDTYRLEILPPLEPVGEAAMTQAYAAIVEEKIRQYPAQWYIFQKFWEPPAWPN